MRTSKILPTLRMPRGRMKFCAVWAMQKIWLTRNGELLNTVRIMPDDGLCILNNEIVEAEPNYLVIGCEGTFDSATIYLTIMAIDNWEVGFITLNEYEHYDRNRIEWL